MLSVTGVMWWDNRDDFKSTMERHNWMSTKRLSGSTVDLVGGEDHYFALAPMGVFSVFSSAVFFSFRI